jgi:lauroyl/myristoyl acyltransferase
LGNALGEIAYRVDRRGRTVALANLRCVYGEKFDPALVAASYRNFVRTMLDLFWGQRLTAENFRTWIRLIGFEELHARLERERKGAIFMCIHQGNWEWANLIGGFTNLPLAAVTENFKNPRLTAIFARLRQHTGQEMIPQENSVLRMLKIVKRRGLTAMLVDLNLRPSQAATVIDAFGGLKMCVPLLHSVLAQRAGALLIPVETQSFPDGTASVTVYPAVEYAENATLAEITQACWEKMQPLILNRPEQWLWPYKHFRYRPKAATREYPAYAHESGKFEKLLKESTAPAVPAKRKRKPEVPTQETNENE